MLLTVVLLSIVANKGKSRYNLRNLYNNNNRSNINDNDNIINDNNSNSNRDNNNNNSNINNNDNTINNINDNKEALFYDVIAKTQFFLPPTSPSSPS